MSGCTPMYAACHEGHLEVAQWLFGAGAAEDVRTPDNGGFTPIFFACSNGHLEVALWLIHSGAATNTTGHIDAIIMQNRAVNKIATRLKNAINVHIANQSISQR
jgi:ankyrin repeat protein